MTDPAVAQNGRATNDLICFSHLRWDFVFQRPQHLLSRAARTMRVIFWEEPIYTGEQSPSLKVSVSPEGVHVAQPHLPWGTDEAAGAAMQRRLLDDMVRTLAIRAPVLWYYTPQALAFSGHLRGTPTVYDCMDELSAFAGADPALPERERELMKRADLVFTGGWSLYEAKRALHPSVHAFPSGVDARHFLPARGPLAEPADQAAIPHPRLGFFGVLDERLDRALLDQRRRAAAGPALRDDRPAREARPRGAAASGRTSIISAPRATPSCQPTSRIGRSRRCRSRSMRRRGSSARPRRRNTSPPGGRSSPPRSATWCAAGATPASCRWPDTPEAFVAAADAAMRLAPDWREAADARLAEMSWDAIWARMQTLLEGARTVPERTRRVIGMRAHYDHLIVGAGFAGAVLAERLAAGSRRRVLVVDRRPHIGGNAYDAPDAAGVLIHPYGPHIFHTNSQAVFDYLSRFTEWRPYEHRVLAEVRGQLLPIPINRQTINRFFGVVLAEGEVEAFLRGKAERIGTVRSSADVVLGTVGRELYEAFFQGYTRKQWGLDPSELDKSVTARVPTRTNDDDRYFADRFQAMPLHGYTRMFRRMLAHPNITIATETEYADIDSSSYDHLIFTGPVDEYFGHRYGKLPYRSLQFRHETHDCERFQPVGVVNYPSPDVRHTRITEFKHLTGSDARENEHLLRIPVGGGRPLLPGAAGGERGAVRTLQDAGGRDPERVVRGPAGDVQILQHGPGGRAGAGDL